MGLIGSLRREPPRKPRPPDWAARFDILVPHSSATALANTAILLGENVWASPERKMAAHNVSMGAAIELNFICQLRRGVPRI